MSVGFYTPSLVDGPNTTPYRHAKTIGEHTSDNILITVRPPPDEISRLYEEVCVLEGQGITGAISRTKTALAIINQFLDSDDVLVTGLGHDSNLVGFLSDSYWIADLWDDPFQNIAANPNSVVYRAATWGLIKILGHADVVFIIQHPDSPLTLGKERIYARNGAPVDKIEPGNKASPDPLQGIVVGKTKLEEGMKLTLDGIKSSNTEISVDIYGEPYSEAATFAENLGISNRVTFHGHRDYQSVCESLKNSHIGFCLLPSRRDWIYSYPLKVGEYLAAGAIPILTPQPGMKDLAGDVGRYCGSKEEVAHTLERIDTLSREELEEQMSEVRTRAEEVPTVEEDKKLLNTVDNYL